MTKHVMFDSQEIMFLVIRILLDENDSPTYTVLHERS